MEAIQEFIDKKKKRVYFGIRMFVVMVLAAALLILLIAHGDIQKILNEMRGAIVTTGVALVSFLISLIVLKFKMVLHLDAFNAEEQARIYREAGKMPQVFDFMITSDVLIYVQGFRVHAIPVRDVVWAYSQTQSSTHVYRGGGLLVPIRHVSQYLVVVLRNKRRVRIPLEVAESNRKAEVLYAYEVMKRKRPKVWMGYEERLDDHAKKNFEALVSFVDKEGTTDGRELEVQYGLNHWYQQEIPGYDVTQNEHIYGILRADIEGVLFTVMMAGAVLAAFLYYLPSSLGGDDITRALQTNRWHFFAPIAVLAAIFVTILIVYIKTVVCDSHRKKYGRLHASYLLMMISWLLFLTSFLLLGGRAYGPQQDSQEESAEENKRVERNGDVWTYGEDTYPSNPNIYGYDELTEEEQCVFDFLQ